MTDTKETQAYSLNDMMGNIRTHIPDFEMATAIMSALQSQAEKDRVMEKMVRDIKSLISYSAYQIKEGNSHHPTLPSMVNQAKATLKDYAKLKGEA